jgi:nicotine blue oxidoreductase
VAAGASRRMGRPKALLPYEGTTFVGHLWSLLNSLPLAWRRVVTSPGLPLVDYPCLINPETERGPIGSIQLALRNGAQDCPWLLVLAVDRPTIALSTLLALVEAAQQPSAELWVPSYQGRRGHPIVFGQACYADLLLAPEARWVAHRHLRAEVAVDDPAIFDQFDTPEELAAMKKGPPREGPS